MYHELSIFTLFSIYFNNLHVSLALLVVDQQSYWDGLLSGVWQSGRPLFVSPITHKREIGIASYRSGELLK